MTWNGRPRLGSWSPLVVACLATALSVSAQEPFKHNVPMVPPGKKAPVPEVSPYLTYYGGPVVSHVVTISVLWGSSVNASVAAAMPGFLTDITSSSYMDWLCEYNTPTQVIGRGTFSGQFTIAPHNTNTNLYDSDIQAELAWQLQNGHLPLPQYDAQGNPESLYVIEFPPGYTITLGSDVSCVYFCAYHSAMDYSGNPLMYAVHPDFSSGGCAGGCGSGSMLQNQESVHTHELIETVTDPEVSFATANGPPLAWYDLNNGEIGDICNGQENPLTVNGHTYTVQSEWSNAQNTCVTGDPSPLAGPILSGTSAVCQGGTISLAASGGTAPYEWLFDPGTGARLVAGQSGATLTVSPAKLSDAGSYYVSSEGSCTTLSSSWPVAVNPLPDAAITTPASVCGGSTGNGASVPPTSGATYSWSVSNGSLTSGQGTTAITYTAGASGSVGLSATVTASTGCASTGQASVAVTQTPPDVGATVLVSIQSGQIQWSWQAVTGATGYEVWRSDTGPSGPFGTLVGTATGGQTSLSVPLGSEPATADYLVQAVDGPCAGPLD